MTGKKVILVSKDRGDAGEVATLLAGAGCEVLTTMTLDSHLCDRLQRTPVDLVAFDVATPDRMVCDCIKAMQTRARLPVVLFSPDDSQASIQRAILAGASAYVSSGVRPERVRSILDAALVRADAYHTLANELENARTQLAERKLIERAKGIVMAQCSLNEEQAYSLMRKNAMDRNKRLAEVAEGIIAAVDLLAERPAARTQAVGLS